VYSCAAGGIERVGLISDLEIKEVSKFGFINQSLNGSVTENVGIYPAVNIFIGPDASFLVRLGAMFPPVSEVLKKHFCHNNVCIEIII
jgi:hypothetical protein